MTAGLPGTGIGGLYYLCLVLWMPIRELWLLAHGRSSARRWAAIGFYLALTTSIAVVTYAQAWALGKMVTTAATAVGASVPGNGQGYNFLTGMALIMSLGVLAALVCGVHVLRLIVKLRDALASRPVRQPTIRTFPELFPMRPIEPPKPFAGRLDQPTRAA